jgi:nucleotide-binding universal stress UspA family protein
MTEHNDWIGRSVPADFSKRPEVKAVLVATDLTEPSLKAVQHGIAIARHYRASLYIVHVVSSVAFTLVGPDAVELGVEASERDMGDMMCNLTLSGALQGVTSQWAVLRGNLVEELESFARDHEAGVIVVGTHGREGLAGLFFGSMAQSISKSCSSPVLIIGQQAGSPWLDSPAGAARPLLVATGLNDDSARVVSFATSLSRELDRGLVVLHVTSPGHMKPIRNVGSASIDSSQSSRRASLGAPLNSGMADKSGTAEYVETCDPAETILHVAKRVDAAAIIMGAHRDLFSELTIRHPWSIASRVNREAKCPVLTVRG